jgi:hypothetical protein
MCESYSSRALKYHVKTEIEVKYNLAMFFIANTNIAKQWNIQDCKIDFSQKITWFTIVLKIIFPMQTQCRRVSDLINYWHITL